MSEKSNKFTRLIEERTTLKKTLNQFQWALQIEHRALCELIHQHNPDFSEDDCKREAKTRRDAIAESIVNDMIKNQKGK